MQLWPESIRWRLTLWYSTTLAVILLAFAAGSFLVLDRVLSARSDRFLGEARDAFITELLVETEEIPHIDDAIRAAERDVRFGEIRFLVFDSALAPAPDEEAIPARTGSTPDADIWAFDPRELRRLLDSLQTTRAHLPPTVASYGDGPRGFRVALRSTILRGRRFHVVALQSRTAQAAILESVALAFALAIPLFLVVAAGGGYMLARQALEPVSEMSRLARQMSASTLDRRLPVANARDELGELATIINDLLGRLQTSFEQQRRFVADASHELRTPVAIIRGEADVTLGRSSRTPTEYRDSLRVMQEAGARLSAIVEDLFLLARADNGELATSREALYLDELLIESVRAMRTIAAQRGIVVQLAPLSEVPYRGDLHLLGRLLLNLLDNAIKFSSPGSEVSVRLVDGGTWWDILVADTGPGIPAHERDQIFSRFYRGDQARARDAATRTGGAGLGLAISRWIAEAHGGRLELLRSGEHGSEFRLRLPKERAERTVETPERQMEPA